MPLTNAPASFLPGALASRRRAACRNSLATRRRYQFFRTSSVTIAPIRVILT